MADKKNFRDMTEQELSKLLIDYKSSLREMRFEKVIGSNFNLSEYRKTKKDVARILTVLREQKEIVKEEASTEGGK